MRIMKFLMVITLVFLPLGTINASIELERDDIYDYKEFFDDLFPTEEEDAGAGYTDSCVSGSSAYMWPIGSEEKTTQNGVELAIGTPYPTVITSYFGSTEAGIHDNGHGALDIAPAADAGVVNVIAAQAGEVVVANTGCVSFEGLGSSCGGGYGNYVAIKSDDGNYQYYGHMHENTLKVKVGDKVVQGQILGKVGSSGRSTGTHLHFEVREGQDAYDARVDPLNYVNQDNPRPSGSNSTNNSSSSSNSSASNNSSSSNNTSNNSSSSNNTSNNSSNSSSTSSSSSSTDSTVSSNDECRFPSVFIELLRDMEGGYEEGDYYIAYDGGDAYPWTVGPGITLAEEDEFRAIGIDPNSISAGSRLKKSDVDKVFEMILQKIRDSIESRLASNNITLNNSQILALVAFEHNGGQTASDNVISSYKQNGNTYKVYSEFCNYVHGTYNGVSGYLYPGLILRRKVEWLMWSAGIFLPTDQDQSYDNNTECVGNFAVPNDKKSMVTPLLEETAKQFGGTITYF